MQCKSDNLLYLLFPWMSLCTLWLMVPSLIIEASHATKESTFFIKSRWVMKKSVTNSISTRAVISVLWLFRRNVQCFVLFLNMIYRATNSERFFFFFFELVVRKRFLRWFMKSFWVSKSVKIIYDHSFPQPGFFPSEKKL